MKVPEVNIEEHYSFLYKQHYIQPSLNVSFETSTAMCHFEVFDFLYQGEFHT
jgi:hypothetical protein